MAKKISESLTKIMTEAELNEEFVPKLKSVVYELVVVLEELLKLRKYPTREMVFTIMKEVDKIETFLDDYEASHNKKFSYFRMLIASIRWVNIATFQGLHVLARVESYRLGLTEKEKQLFIEKLQETVNRCLADLKILSKELKAELAKIGIRKPRARFTEKKDFAEIQKKILPPDIDSAAAKATTEAIIDILVKFLENSELFNSFFCRNGSDGEYTEEVWERYRSTFNRLESLYDTYLRSTEIEEKHSDLRGIRSSIAVTLHLLEMGKALAHFQERHSEKLLTVNPAFRARNFANKNEIKKTMQNFIISYAISFLQIGKSLSEKIFREMGKEAGEYIYTTKMLKVQSHRLEDFHIRPIMPVTQLAGKYNLDTYLYQNRNKYNLKSAIEMAIAIPDIRDDLEKGNIEMMLQGPRKAVEEISSFFHERCGAIEKEIVCNAALSRKEI